MIVKVQLSLYTDRPDRQVLVHDRWKKHLWMEAATPEVLKRMGDEVKAFFCATVKPNGQCVLGERAPDLDW